MQSKIFAMCVVCTVWLSGGASSLAEGPSFDCKVAKTPDDQAICASDELSSLERTMTKDYRYALSVGDQSMVRALARKNLARRRACKQDVACLRLALAAAARSYHDQDTPEPPPENSQTDIDALGVAVRNIEGNAQEAYAGVLIVAIADRKPAQTADIREGDIIVSFNNQRIERSDELEKCVRNSPRSVELPVLISRGGDQAVKIVKLIDLN